MQEHTPEEKIRKIIKANVQEICIFLKDSPDAAKTLLDFIVADEIPETDQRISRLNGGAQAKALANRLRGICHEGSIIFKKNVAEFLKKNDKFDRDPSPETVDAMSKVIPGFVKAEVAAKQTELSQSKQPDKISLQLRRI